MEKPRHFPLRHDLFDHPRTSWMYPDDLAVFALISSASILGVCTYSERKIAKKTKVPLDRVPMVLHALQTNGNCKWWPEDEIVWSVERADESGVGGNALVGAQREWREYPDHVREAIASRYPRIATDLGYNPPGTIRDNPPTKPPTEGGTPTPTVTVTVRVPPVVNKGAHEDAECAAVAEGLAWIVPAGRKRLLYRDERVRPLVRAGASAEEILAVVRRHKDNVESGAVPPEQWSSTYVFSGWFDGLRDEASTVRRESL